VVSDDGGLTLEIPPGALAEDTVIEIEAADASVIPDRLEGLEILGPVYRLEPSGLEFSEPVGVTRLLGSVLAGDETHQIPITTMLSRDADGAWGFAGRAVTVDADATAAIIGEIEHFSDLVVVRSLTAGEEGTETEITVEFRPQMVERRVGQDFRARISLTTYLDFHTEHTSTVMFVQPPGPGPLVAEGSTNFSGNSVGSTNTISYRCSAPGNDGFRVEYHYYLFPPENMFTAIGLLFLTLEEKRKVERTPFEVEGTMHGQGICAENDDDLPPGIYTFGGDVTADDCVHEPWMPPLPQFLWIHGSAGAVTAVDLAQMRDPARLQGPAFDPVPVPPDHICHPAALDDPPPGFPLGACAADPSGAAPPAMCGQEVGTVAQRDGIEVWLGGDASEGRFEGTLIKGSAGGLPGGCPIIYDVRAEFLSPHPGPFLDDLAAAFNDAEPFFLMDHLHPGIVEHYGEQTCWDFVNGVWSPTLEFEVHGITEFGPWEVPLPDGPLTLDDILTLYVTRSEDGAAVEQELHLGVVDGELLWLVACGG
jgi:hypothetical protein